MKKQEFLNIISMLDWEIAEDIKREIPEKVSLLQIKSKKNIFVTKGIKGERIPFKELRKRLKIAEDFIFIENLPMAIIVAIRMDAHKQDHIVFIKESDKYIRTFVCSKFISFGDKNETIPLGSSFLVQNY